MVSILLGISSAMAVPDSPGATKLPCHETPALRHYAWVSPDERDSLMVGDVWKITRGDCHEEETREAHTQSGDRPQPGARADSGRPRSPDPGRPDLQVRILLHEWVPVHVPLRDRQLSPIGTN